MGKPAARVGDMHLCPMVTPGVPPIPHVGGPIPMGCPTVLIGGMPAARVGDIAICVGPPSSIMMGSPTVLIGGMMAARMTAWWYGFTGTPHRADWRGGLWPGECTLASKHHRRSILRSLLLTT
jgi:uncharacterized Zn-binding protein involved in type VI secretion